MEQTVEINDTQKALKSEPFFLSLGQPLVFKSSFFVMFLCPVNVSQEGKKYQVWSTSENVSYIHPTLALQYL